MATTCSSVITRPRVNALNMMGNKYRLKSGLPPFPVNHSTQVMNTSIDHDSISSLERVRPGRKWRPRNPTIASAKAASSPRTGHT